MLVFYDDNNRSRRDGCRNLGYWVTMFRTLLYTRRFVVDLPEDVA